MKVWVGTFARVAGVVLSLAVLVAAGWLWHRSLAHADLIARVEPAGGGERELTGVGSYKGAVLIGAIKDPPAILSSPTYAHSVFSVPRPGQGSMLHVVPEYKHSELGFGVSRGELKLQIPLLFWMKPPPPSEYRVVYVPYYFIMLLAVVMPARAGWSVGRRRGAASAQPLRVEAAEVTS